MAECLQKGRRSLDRNEVHLVLDRLSAGLLKKGMTVGVKQAS